MEVKIKQHKTGDGHTTHRFKYRNEVTDKMSVFESQNQYNNRIVKESRLSPQNKGFNEDVKHLSNTNSSGALKIDTQTDARLEKLRKLKQQISSQIGGTPEYNYANAPNTVRMEKPISFIADQ